MEIALERDELDQQKDELEVLLDYIASHTVPECLCVFGSILGSIVLLVLLTYFFYSNVSSVSEFLGAFYIIASLAHLFVIPTVLTAVSLRFIEFRGMSSVVLMLFSLVLCTRLNIGEEGIVSNVMFLTFCALFSVSFSMLSAKVFKFEDDTVGRVLCSVLTLFAVYAFNRRFCGGGMTFTAVWVIFVLLVCLPYELGYFWLKVERGDSISPESRPGSA